MAKLLTVKELNALPRGTKLLTIMGKSLVKGVDRLSKDTRHGGLTAYSIAPKTKRKSRKSKRKSSRKEK